MSPKEGFVVRIANGETNCDYDFGFNLNLCQGYSEIDEANNNQQYLTNMVQHFNTNLSKKRGSSEYRYNQTYISP